MQKRDGPVGTLARGLMVLNALIEARAPSTLSDVASVCSLDQSTTLRLLRALEDAGYVIRPNGGREYFASPKALRPLALTHPLEKLRRDTMHVLEGLAKQLSLTAVLAIFIGGERMVLEIVEAPGSLSPYYKTWLQRDLHVTAVGKALLASVSAEKRSSLLGPEPFVAYTPHTITRRDALEAELEEGRERGFWVAADEHQVGLTAVASSFNSWSGKTIGCLAVTGHSDAIKGEARAKAGEMLRSAAELLRFQTNALDAVEAFCGLREERTEHDQALYQKAARRVSR